MSAWGPSLASLRTAQVTLSMWGVCVWGGKECVPGSEPARRNNKHPWGVGVGWGCGWDQVLPLSLPQVGPKGGRSCLGEKPWLEVEPELREMPSPHAWPGQVRDGVWGVAVALLPLGSLHV